MGLCPVTTPTTFPFADGGRLERYDGTRWAAVVLRSIDARDTSCAFASHGCSNSMGGHGGFDEHHRWPKSMGGPEHPGDLLALCPNHHARQHALVRYLVETADPLYAVLRHFTAAELEVADYALARWREAGSPPIAGWSRPAAR